MLHDCSSFKLVQQVREKNDKFQQRRLDSFFKASVQQAEAADDDEEEAEEQPVPLEVMAMEVEMEVCLTAYWSVLRHASKPVVLGYASPQSLLCFAAP